MRLPKDEIIKKLLLELIETYPKNKIKLVDKLYELFERVSDNAALKYYRMSKNGVFRYEHFDVREMMAICEENKELYKQDPMLLVYAMEDCLHNQMNKHYGNEE